jgi:hypothetical protein
MVLFSLLILGSFRPHPARLARLTGSQRRPRGRNSKAISLQPFDVNRNLVRFGWLFSAVVSASTAGAADGLAGRGTASEPRAEAVRLAGHYVKTVVSRAQAEAATQALERERQSLSSGARPGGNVAGMLSTLADDEQRALTEIVEKEGDRVVRALDRATEKAAAERKHIVDDWLNVRTAQPLVLALRPVCGRQRGGGDPSRAAP